MRKIIIAQTFLAIVLATVGLAAQRDNASAADGCLVYSLKTPGSAPDFLFGSAVATGDVDGDGNADIIVGAPVQNKVHVFSGTDGALLYSLSMPDPMTGAGFGRALTTADVDSDGKADIIVSAPSETVGSSSDQGRVYVFSGDGGALLYTLDTPNPGPSGLFGSSLAAGDEDGDGKPDVIVAAPFETIAPNSNTGRVYVFSGADGSLLRAYSSPYSDQFGEFGMAVAAADVDDDGRADTVIGAWLGDFFGESPFIQSYAYIFAGTDGSLLRTLSRPQYARDAEFGSTLAAGDVNGDGNADVMVGDPPGMVYVFDGADGSLLYTLLQPDPIPTESPTFGAALAAGDVNGDGDADVIVGTLPDNFADPDVGRVYVFSGADGSLVNTLDTPNPTLWSSAFFGAAVATGDINGDGNADVMVGAPDRSFFDQGWAYVFLHESDDDGCADAKELLLVPPTDPLDPWDFFSVPVPALFAAQYPTTVFRDGTVSTADAEAVFAYFKKGAKTGTTEYEQDLNLNGIRDGLEYDRSVLGPGHSGPPDGVVSATDAQLAFAQFKMGYKC